MIYGYEIKKINNEETLCLYFDFSTEFAKLDSKEKRKKLMSTIKDYMKKNNIKFKGEKVALLSGGILIATLMFKSPKVNLNENTFQETYPSSVIVLKDNTQELENQFKEKLKSLETITQNKQNETQTSKKINNKNTQSQKTSSQKTTSTSSNVKAIKKTSSASSNNKVQETLKQPITDKTETSQKQDTNTTPENKNNIYVSVKRKSGVIEKIELEEYIIGVVGAEMPASFHSEALKSQAVIARTYAIKAIEQNKTLTDDSSTQNYKSTEELRSTWKDSFNKYYEKIKSAVKSTKGLYLTYKGKTIEAVYHSTSNGTTEDASNVWGNSFPYLKPVSSPYDINNPSYQKITHLTYETISNKLSIPINEHSEITILSKTEGNRIKEISIDNSVFTGVIIRNKLGLRSADFDIEKTSTGISFTTRGYGHGVGLSQYGANGLAKNGANFDTILKHYYINVDISHYG